MAEVTRLNRKCRVAFIIDNWFDGYDFLSTYAIFAQFPDRFDLHTVSIAEPRTTPDGGLPQPVETLVGWSVLPDMTLDDPSAATAHDVLVLPALDMACIHRPRAVKFLKAAAAAASHTLTICFSSAVLAELGLLDGKEATGTRAVFSGLHAHGPRVRWRPDRRWVDAGTIWSSSGASAGVDMVAHFVAARHRRGSESPADVLAAIEAATGSRLAAGPDDDPFPGPARPAWFSSTWVFRYLIDAIPAFAKANMHQDTAIVAALANTLRPFSRSARGRFGKLVTAVVAADGVDASAFATLHTLLAYDFPNTSTYSVALQTAEAAEDAEDTKERAVHIQPSGLRLTLDHDAAWLAARAASVNLLVVMDSAALRGDAALLRALDGIVSAAGRLEAVVAPANVLAQLPAVAAGAVPLVVRLEPGVRGSIAAYSELTTRLKTDGPKTSLDFSEISPANRP
ncbi:hypothetical protein HK405_008216 [Cladochytrium tenue]|nr:hypothetical protein HK405_008216 [Cladochytrium tenue]